MHDTQINPGLPLQTYSPFSVPLRSHLSSGIVAVGNIEVILLLLFGFDTNCRCRENISLIYIKYSYNFCILQSIFQRHTCDDIDVSIDKVRTFFREMLLNPEMDKNSALIFNAGAHYVKVTTSQQDSKAESILRFWQKKITIGNADQRKRISLLNTRIIHHF